MTIKDWPCGERPREKLIHNGAGALTDAEILAVLLRCGQRGQDAVAHARSLLSASGGLRALLELRFEQFCRLPGCGPAAFASLGAALELSRRYRLAGLNQGVAMESHTQVADYLVERMKSYQREVFGCLFLDTRHRIIAWRELFLGTIDRATVHPREVVKACLETNCAALILAHNHPSGAAEPSAADRALTAQIARATALIEVRVLDHFVVGATEAVSMAALGQIDRLEPERPVLGAGSENR